MAGKVIRTPDGEPMPARWSQDWKVYHSYGLRAVITSGRVSRALFLEPLSRDALEVVSLIPNQGDTPWMLYVIGRLVAGIGTEILLKGLYLKNGYSIRKPRNLEKQPLARRDTEQDFEFSPYLSATLHPLLAKHNLELIGAAYLRPLMVAKWWRDEPAHVPVWERTMTEFGSSSSRWP